MSQNQRVLLCNPSFPRKLKGAPLSLLYLSGSLKHPSTRFNGEACLLDLNTSDDPEKALAEALSDFKPTHFGITRFTPNAIESGLILAKVKEHDRRVITISGGPHEIFHGAGTPSRLAKAVDHVVRDSDGVKTFLKILGMESQLRTLDILPDYDLILPERARYQFGGLFKKPMTQMITSTGCNCACSFCGVKHLELADLGVVMDNLEHVLSRGFGAIIFDDGNFISDRQRTLEFARKIIERGFSLEWGCQTRADSIDSEVLSSMRESGCTYICTALESADTRVLRAIRKGIEPADVETAVRLIRQSGMLVGLYAMFGHPIELRHPEIAIATLDMIEQLRPDFLSVSMFARYRGILNTDPINREREWLFFDEGWGAQHDAPLSYAIQIKETIEARMINKPEIWSRIRIF